MTSVIDKRGKEWQVFIILKIDLVMCYPILLFLFPSLNNRGADTEQRKPKLGCQYVIQKVVVKKERKLNQAYLPLTLANLLLNKASISM
jgi:hypothetical protein